MAMRCQYLLIFLTNTIGAIVSARPSGPIILTMVVNNWSSDAMVPLKFFLLKSGSQSSRDQNFHDDVLDCDDDQGGCKSKEPVTQERRDFISGNQCIGGEWFLMLTTSNINQIGLTNGTSRN